MSGIYVNVLILKYEYDAHNDIINIHILLTYCDVSFLNCEKRMFESKI